MVAVTTSADCGNAPKQEFVRDLLTAGVRQEFDDVDACFAGDATFRRAGERSFRGSDAPREFVSSLALAGLEELALDTVISHGKMVAASGELRGSGDPQEFCLMVTFTGHGRTALIEQVVAYFGTSGTA